MFIISVAEANSSIKKIWSKNINTQHIEVIGKWIIIKKSVHNSYIINIIQSKIKINKRYNYSCIKNKLNIDIIIYNEQVSNIWKG